MCSMGAGSNRRYYIHFKPISGVTGEQRNSLIGMRHTALTVCVQSTSYQYESANENCTQPPVGRSGWFGPQLSYVITDVSVQTKRPGCSKSERPIQHMSLLERCPSSISLAKKME